MPLPSGEDEYNKLRRRVARLEVLTTLTYLDLDTEIDADTLGLVLRYLRDDDRRPTQGLDDILRLFVFDRRQFQPNIQERLAGFQRGQDEFQRTLTGRQNELETEMKERWSVFLRRADETTRAVDSLKQEQRALSANTHEWLAAPSLGIDSVNLRLSRFLPLRVYLSEAPGNAVKDVSRAVDWLLEAFGFEFADEFPAILGSWSKRWFAKTAEVMTQPEVAQRLEKLERALELKGLGQPQADIDTKQAAAVAQLTKAMKDTPNAAIQVGSILFIKLSSENGPIIQVRTLTQTELIHLENNQSLLTSPTDLLERLSDICRAGTQKSDSTSHIKRRGGRKRKGSGEGVTNTLKYIDNESEAHESAQKRLSPPAAQ